MIVLMTQARWYGGGQPPPVFVGIAPVCHPWECPEHLWELEGSGKGLTGWSIPLKQPRKPELLSLTLLPAWPQPHVPLRHRDELADL